MPNQLTRFSLLLAIVLAAPVYAQTLLPGSSVNGTVVNDAIGESTGLVAPGAVLPINIDPFAESPLTDSAEHALEGLDQGDANLGEAGYNIELVDKPVMIIKQHALNPLIDLGETSTPEESYQTSDEDGIPILDLVYPGKK